MDDEEDAAALGSALGWRIDDRSATLPADDIDAKRVKRYLIHHADDEALLFDLVSLDSVLILQDLACRSISILGRTTWSESVFHLVPAWISFSSLASHPFSAEIFSLTEETWSKC